MVQAELRNKLGTDGSRAHDRAEDLLTSTVFGLLRYLPLREGLLSLLGRARPVRAGGDGIEAPPHDGWIDVSGVTRAELSFWPSFGPFGEPDLLIHLWDGERLLHAVLIEAKLHSPKSGAAGESAEDATEEDVPHPDQLVRYWRGLQLRPEVTGVGCSLVYMTSRSMPPLKELHESIVHSPEMRLAWLHWGDAWAVAHRVATSGDCLPAQDLAALLAHKGFRGFIGFDQPSIPTLQLPASFWRPRKLFRGSPPPEEVTRFWEKPSTFWRMR